MNMNAILSCSLQKIGLQCCCYGAALAMFGACAIENDIPYPIVEGSIQAIEVEGQCDAEGNSSTQATINKKEQTVQLYVDDTVNPAKLRITKLSVTNQAVVVPVNDIQCISRENFPPNGFESLSELPASADTRMNFSQPVGMTLRTYQDYQWTVNVNQVVNRNIVLENQIGNAVIDVTNRKAVVYVTTEQPLDKVAVKSFQLGGQHGTVTPDPTETATFDFSQPCKFFVKHAWEDFSHEWEVFVYQKKEEGGENLLFPMSTKSIINGTVTAGKKVKVEYKRETDANWKELADAYILVNGTQFTATLHNLQPGTSYLYRITIGTQTGEEVGFKTAPATPLTDGDLDNWHQDGRLQNPWAAGGTSFWDTGNRGATTIGNSNTLPTDETCNGKGKAAMLESKYLAVKFAAGNLFTGSYLKTTGTNGVLSFGRPFSAFPTKLRFHYKYQSTTINKIGEDALEYLKGRPDSCHVYIALTDWDEPREIRTRPSERQLFDKNDPKIIAYAELIKGENVNSYEQVDLTLDYRALNRTPKYIAVIATASKYGDYFTGGEGSKLWLDNFELIYE